MPIGVPPQLTVYHAIVAPEPPTAVRVTEPPSLEHIFGRSAEADVGAIAVEGIVVTVILAHADGVQLVVSHLAK